MPGDDLLFHRLSDSTIGAVWFHGRVRDGIGWVTDAMATKQWGQRETRGQEIDACTLCVRVEPPCSLTRTSPVIDGGTLKRE
jgi:hypothetical protein